VASPSGKLPPGYVASGAYVDGKTDTAPGWAWGAFLLPYLEQDSLDHQFPVSQPVQGCPAAQTVVNSFVCPADIGLDAPFAVTDASWVPVCWEPPSSYAACRGGGVSTTAATGNGYSPDLPVVPVPPVVVPVPPVVVPVPPVVVPVGGGVLAWW